MASPDKDLEEDMSCPVCLDLYTDPLVLGCSHSFCRSCVEAIWKDQLQGQPRECPLCRSTASDTPTTNLVLQKIVETRRKQEGGGGGQGGGGEEQQEKCRLHGERLLLYCSEDQELLCVVCQTSRNHKDHQLCPLEEAALDCKEEMQADLNPLKAMFQVYLQAKQETEKTNVHFQLQASETQNQIKKQFEEFHHFLHMEEAARLSKLSGEVDVKLGVLQEKMKNLEKTATSLSTTFSKAEEARSSPDYTFLQAYKGLKERLSVPVPPPEVLAGALLEVPTHLGNLGYQVWEKMQPMVTYSPVTLDPNTAAHGLSVSNDLTGMIQHGNRGHAPDNPERFSGGSGFVLGAQVYLEGTHTWEVDLGNRDRWVLGVALQGASRSGQVEPDEKHGFWTVALKEGGRYVASTRPGTLLTTRPTKVVVVLDCVARSVAFYNADVKSLLFRFQGLPEGPLRAVFSPGGEDQIQAPLKILPTQMLGTFFDKENAVKRLVRILKVNK